MIVLSAKTAGVVALTIVTCLTPASAQESERLVGAPEAGFAAVATSGRAGSATTPAAPVIKPLDQASDGAGDIPARFADLVEQWKADSPRWMDMTARVQHDAYRQIVAMGDRAVSLLLEQLRQDGDFWFYALREITHADPVWRWQRGRVDAVCRAWLSWGRKQGRIA